MQHHVVFLDRDSVRAEVRRPAFPHTWEEYSKTSGDQVLARLGRATIAIVNKVPLRAETLERLAKLKMIAVAATGTDNVDLDYCRNAKIAVANIRNYATHTVPEHAFAMILALKRNLLAYRRDVENGEWNKSDQFCLFTHPIEDLHGSTIGIFGEGAIGQGAATIARGFGMKVLFADHEPPKAPNVEFTPMETVLAEADVISLHLPLTPSTRHMIGLEQFKKMKKSAVLINTARGGLVDEAALIQALKEGLIAGAGFDVLIKEPPKEGNPLLDLKLPNFILTPHCAWASRGAMQFLADQLIDNVEAFVKGEPQNLMN